MSKEEIINLIKSAFAGTTLGGGKSLSQLSVVDRRSDDYTLEQYQRLKDQDITDDWTKIPFSVLEKCEAYGHLDSEGLRYYIAPLMISVLQNYDPCSLRVIGTLAELTRVTGYMEQDAYRYRCFNRQQVIAITQYLQSLPYLVKLESDDQRQIERSLQLFWNQYVTQLN